MSPAPARPMPWAYGIEFKDGKRATLLDYGRALQMAAYHGGQLVTLYDHPPPVPLSPADIASASRGPAAIPNERTRS